MINSIITGSGSEIPKKHMPNSAFLDHEFYNKKGQKIEKFSSEIIAKLEQISGIKGRRYVSDDMDTADLAVAAARKAINDSGLADESIDGIIVAHNFGNLEPGSSHGNLLPNLAALVKNRLDIKNHKCPAIDLLFGCPGWLEALIVGHQYIKAGTSKNVLIVGVELISRVLDFNDLDSMLFGDGAGAVILSAVEEEEPRGILSHTTYSHCNEEAHYLYGGKNTEPGREDVWSPKMDGRKVFRYGMTYLPEVITESLEEANLQLKEINKMLFHQANEKMIRQIARQLLDQHELKEDIEDLVPFIVQDTGNSSVATIPTMMDFMRKGKLGHHTIQEGDNLVMASVGAGMHCNSVVYRA